MEGFLSFIVVMTFLVLMFGGFRWVMAKYFGTHFYGKFEGSKTRREHNDYELIIQDYTIKNPQLVKKAIDICNKKGYSKTHYNILSEIRKIENEAIKEQNLKNKISEKISSIRFKINSGASNEIEKLQKLNELRKEGGLTNEEYLEFKKDIISNISKKRTTPQSKVLNSDATTNQYNPTLSLNEHNTKMAIQTINLLYFEFKDEVDDLKNLKLNEVYNIIFNKGNSFALIKSYENLFQLYTNDLITKEEFTIKKKQIIIKSLKS